MGTVTLLVLVLAFTSTTVARSKVQFTRFRSWNSRMYPVWRDGDSRFRNCWTGGNVSFEVRNDAPTLTGAKATFNIDLRFPANQSVLSDGQVVWARNCTVDGRDYVEGQAVYADRASGRGGVGVFPDGSPFNRTQDRKPRYVFVWKTWGRFWQVADGPSSSLSLDTNNVPLGSYKMEVVIYHSRGDDQFIPLGYASTQFSITDQIPFTISLNQINDVNQNDQSFIQNRAIAFNVRLHDPSQYLSSSDLTFNWDFGDQTGTLISRELSVTHTYLSPGAFKPKVVLMATIPNACAETTAVAPVAPSAAPVVVVVASTPSPIPADDLALAASVQPATDLAVDTEVEAAVAPATEGEAAAAATAVTPETVEAVEAVVVPGDEEAVVVPAAGEAVEVVLAPEDEEVVEAAVAPAAEGEAVAAVTPETVEAVEAVVVAGDEVVVEAAVAPAGEEAVEAPVTPATVEAVEAVVVAGDEVAVEAAVVVPEAGEAVEVIVAPEAEEAVEVVVAPEAEEVVEAAVAAVDETAVPTDAAAVAVAVEGVAVEGVAVEAEEALVVEAVEPVEAVAVVTEAALADNVLVPAATESTEAVAEVAAAVDAEAEVAEVEFNEGAVPTEVGVVAAESAAEVEVTAENEPAQVALVLTKRQAPEAPADCTVYRYGSLATSVEIIQGIESVEILQVSNVVSLTTELGQNAVDLTISCQGSLPSEVCTVVSDADCVTPVETVCGAALPSPDCQLVLRQFFNGTGEFCVNVSLTNDVSLAATSARVSVTVGSAGSPGGTAATVLGVMVIVGVMGTIGLMYRRVKQYQPLREEGGGSGVNAITSVPLLLWNLLSRQSPGESRPLLQSRGV